MNISAPRWLRHSPVVAAATLFVGCAGEAPLGPDRQPAFRAQHAAAPASARVGAAATGSAAARNDKRGLDLEGCEELQAPEGSKLAFHVYATGVQIYRWNGTSWTFIAPSAELSADAGGRSTVGIHYAGPTWESVSGSKVVGTVLERCTPDPNAIPWLLLEAVSAQGPGVFHRVTYIQRVNTVGGTAPTASGSFTGEEVEVAYTAEYFFYRTK